MSEKHDAEVLIEQIAEKAVAMIDLGDDASICRKVRLDTMVADVNLPANYPFQGPYMRVRADRTEPGIGMYIWSDKSRHVGENVCNRSPVLKR